MAGEAEADDVAVDEATEIDVEEVRGGVKKWGESVLIRCYGAVLHEREKGEGRVERWVKRMGFDDSVEEENVGV